MQSPSASSVSRHVTGRPPSRATYRRSGPSPAPSVGARERAARAVGEVVQLRERREPGRGVEVEAVVRIGGGVVVGQRAPHAEGSPSNAWPAASRPGSVAVAVGGTHTVHACTPAPR